MISNVPRLFTIGWVLMDGKDGKIGEFGSSILLIILSVNFNNLFFLYQVQGSTPTRYFKMFVCLAIGENS
jgi:hypothetical protein